MTDTDTATFRVGRTYTTRRATDHTQRLVYLVVKRTPHFVTLQDARFPEREPVRVKVHPATDGGGEWAMPEGTYSMAPVIFADRDRQD